MPFPFAKHDLVLIPAFPFGGMEHAGATFLDEAAIASARRRPWACSGGARSSSSTRPRTSGSATSSTMRTFDDLWLKEGFANLCAALIAETPATCRGSPSIA